MMVVVLVFVVVLARGCPWLTYCSLLICMENLQGSVKGCGTSPSSDGTEKWIGVWPEKEMSLPIITVASRGRTLYSGTQFFLFLFCTHINASRVNGA